MKKLICAFLSVLMLLSSVSALADTPIGIYLNGQKLETDVAPIIVNDRTMVPFRAVLEALGAEVSWNEAVKKVFATLGTKNIILTIDSEKMHTTENGEVVIITLDAKPFIQDGRTMIPIRAVCEIFGCEVGWDAPSRSVTIRMPGYEGPALPDYVTNPPAQEGIVDSGAYYEKDNKALAETAVSLINNYRTAEGLAPLAYSTELAGVAYYHCKDMADNDYLDHTSPDGTTFYQRIDENNIPYTIAAENIAFGFTSPEKVVESWMSSPAHKENLLNPSFTKAAVGFYSGGSNGTYWTLIVIAD